MKTTEQKMSLEDAVSTAFGNLQQLGEEVREAFDNTPESLQQSAAGEARDTAATALEELDQPDVPEPFKATEITRPVRVRTPTQQQRLSRSARRDEACEWLSAVIDFLADVDGDNADEAAEFVIELERLRDDADAVEFPGRNG